jgi:peptidoglycan/LPS O-acetylase OafA/YrhL
MVAKMNALYYAAAATSAIAGILHLVLAPNILGFNLNTGIFFIVAGMAQLFWVVPMIRRWGRPWYLIGIGGTIVLIILFAITRMPDNPITGRAGPIMPMAIAIEVFQAAFIGLSIAIIIYEIRRKRISGKTAAETT